MPFAVAFIGKHVCLLLENLTLELLRHICSTNKASQAAIRGNLLRWTRHLDQLGACIGSVQSGSRAVKQAQLIGSTHSFVHAFTHLFLPASIRYLLHSGVALIAVDGGSVTRRLENVFTNRGVKFRRLGRELQLALCKFFNARVNDSINKRINESKE